ncbi:MAG: hypothetical protein COU11_02340 [Candidatus Harrisonbacteria bacterium CG10_big_fil_rev_8_21_14_0_10_49_15]|uniref:L-threonylcarbamoyladenylate synthase n=1 Tax=Candidatus Harrisonbacteria bacterium CG10_big_fil_rev_8_21_14_0_10_49_15 TaxID=1974587 RepID=A0A2H0UMQ0_9BACT|nr:MAG: hypothetical protein COU11_02340 [Candidatus Harrisonbacteria bacterium CG10_big_fil_rev_8_21_14_0_10_49_15]
MTTVTQENVVHILKQGGVGVLATDTIYGVVGTAINKNTVGRIQDVKERPLDKPFIILINSLEEVELFGVVLTDELKKTLKRVWPGRVSVILPVSPSAGFRKYFYLHQGKRELAFRLPKSAGLRTVLRRVGPLVAPSANPLGKKPAETLAEAEAYFGDAVDFYYGKLAKAGTHSTLVRLVDDDSFEIIRAGAGKIPKDLLL